MFQLSEYSSVQLLVELLVQLSVELRLKLLYKINHKLNKMLYHQSNTSEKEAYVDKNDK